MEIMKRKRHKLNKEEIVKVILGESHKLENVINNDFLKGFIKLHNIPPEHNFLNIKQEILASRAYFPGVKKKHCLYVVNKEGITVEELESRGLVVRRSDYPSITKERIKEILNLLVKEETLKISEIRKLIWKTRDQLLEMLQNGSREVGRPVSFNKPLKEYKMIPGHIRGMILWNKLEYNYFVTGTRGYMFRITGIDQFQAPDKILEKLPNIEICNYIVIPFEEERVPEYYQIDINQGIEFSWDTRVRELLQPIWPQIDKTTQRIDDIDSF